MLRWWIDALGAWLTPPEKRGGRDIALAAGALPTPSGPDRIRLGEADAFVATARLGPGETVVGALPRIAPIDPGALLWKAQTARTPGGARVMRVAMARRARIDAILAAYPAGRAARPTILVERDGARFVLVEGGAGSSPAARATVVALLAAMALILTIPLTSFAGARLLASMQRSQTRALEGQGGQALAAKRAADSERALAERLRPVLGRATIGGLIGDTARRLPEGARLASISRDLEGRLTVEVDSVDPDPVRAALAPLGLQPTGQQPVTDRGIRSRFEAQQ